MKTSTPKPLTRKQKAELKRLSEKPEEEIDVGDMPEVIDWSEAKRGLFYRPVKRQLTLRIDADVLAWFRRRTVTGKGYQTAINQALRQYMERQRRNRKTG